MNIEVRGKNVTVKSYQAEYAEKKLAKLNKYIDDEKTAQVALSREGDLYKVEVTIALNGLILRGEEKNADERAAIDAVVDKLERQFDKHKTKLYKRYRESGIKYMNAEPVLPEPVKDEPFHIVRSKKFALKPMDEEEAIMQMNMLGHNFFVFFNMKTKQVNVVYKRNNANEYGLIEPEF